MSQDKIGKYTCGDCGWFNYDDTAKEICPDTIFDGYCKVDGRLETSTAPECSKRKAFRVCRDEVRRLREENEILHRDLFYKG